MKHINSIVFLSIFSFFCGLSLQAMDGPPPVECQAVVYPTNYSWGNLDAYVLGVILNTLDNKDACTAVLVCKRWLASNRNIGAVPDEKLSSWFFDSYAVHYNDIMAELENMPGNVLRRLERFSDSLEKQSLALFTAETPKVPSLQEHVFIFYILKTIENFFSDSQIESAASYNPSKFDTQRFNETILICMKTKGCANNKVIVELCAIMPWFFRVDSPTAELLSLFNSCFVSKPVINTLSITNLINYTIATDEDDVAGQCQLRLGQLYNNLANERLSDEEQDLWNTHFAILCLDKIKYSFCMHPNSNNKLSIIKFTGSSILFIFGVPRSIGDDNPLWYFSKYIGEKNLKRLQL